MNKPFLKISFLILGVYLTGLISACRDDDPALPDNLLNFEVSSTGMEDNVQEEAITLNLSRTVSRPVDLAISFTTEGVTYGEHFTTDPAATGNTLVITIPANTSSASFKVIRNENVFLDGGESITFKIDQVPSASAVVLGETFEMTLSFSSIVSEGANLQLNGLIAAESGASAGNAVFVDFSSNQQKPVARTSWDLGFHTGEPFRVIINNTSGASAVAVDETSLNAVTMDDVDMEALTIPLGVPGEPSFSMIDDVSGDVVHTVIAEVSATPEDNKVYVLNRVGGSHGAPVVAENLIKVRILRNDNGGYTLQYAKLAEATFHTIDVAKTENTNFSYITFGSGEIAAASPVSIEPSAWDIEWTWSVYYGGASDNRYPYGFSDIVFINHLAGVKAAEVLTSTVSYESFSEGDLAGLELRAERNVIGANWRATTGTIGVKTDRFYIVQDAEGNSYKLKFVSFHASDGGTRGKPVIEYALVKKADS